MRARLLFVFGIASVAALPLATTPCRATDFRDPTWLVGFGGSLATPYKYDTYYSVGSFDLAFGETWMASLNAARRLGSKTYVQTSLDYFRNGEGSLSIDAASFHAGLRRLFGGSSGAKQYAEVLPGIFGARWSEELRGSETSFRPGLQIGAGIVGRVAGRFYLDGGVKFHFSSKWPKLSGDPSERGGYFRGVRRTTLGGRILYGI